MNKWTPLSAPIFGGDNFRIAQQMSAMVKDGEVPDFDAVLYAMQASEDAGDMDCSEGFRFKYDGAALGAD